LTIQWNVYQPATDISVLAPHDLVVGDSITFSGVVRVSGDINLNGTFGHGNY
jgi:hypothetical protein